MSWVSEDTDISVLHVDDEPEFADLAATFLEREDDRFSIDIATSAKEGLERLDEYQPDCIISDYEMPGMDGIDFLESVREDHPGLPFILYTGKGSEEVASEAISAGVTEYLQKERGTNQYTILANRITNAVAQVRTRQEIERTREYYSQILEHTSDYVMIVDEHGSVDYVSPAVERVMGYTPDEVDGADTFRRIHPDDLSLAAETFADVIEQPEQEHAVEYRARHADGSWRWLEVRGRNLLDHPVIGGVLVSVRDITARIERQQELERRNDLFGKAQAIANVGAWAENRETGEKLWTDQVYEMHGVSKDFETNLDNLLELYHPADRPKLREAIQDALSEGDPYDLELRMTARDGDTRWFRAVADPQIEDGDVARVRGIVHDITDRVEREQELRQYEHFFKNSPDQIALLDEDLTVQYQSPPSSLHELDAIEVEGDNPLEYVHPDDRQTLSDQFEELLRHPDESLSEEFRAKDVSGEWRWVQMRAINLLDEEPADGILVMIRDITQQKRQQRKRKRQNERLDEFTSIVSHDLRSPLSVAEGHLELAQDTCESDHLAQAADAIDRSQALVDDLLTLAQGGDDVSEVEPVEFADVAESSWQTVETGAGTLEVDGSRLIEADRSRCKQLFENLYRNAVEHGGDDVTVSVGPMDAGFYVADTGPGIPEGDREEVFEAGYSTREEGTGFGLRIVEQVTEAHGWDITVTDSADGGARFEVTGVEFAE